MMRELERHLFLCTIDEHWRDHLYELDHLKGGIGLRAYGQRDPLIEYKKEAFALFEALLDEVDEDFVQRLFRVQLAPEAVRQAERAAARRAGWWRSTPRRRAPSRRRDGTGDSAEAGAAPAGRGRRRGAAPARRGRGSDATIRARAAAARSTRSVTC